MLFFLLMIRKDSKLIRFTPYYTDFITFRSFSKTLRRFHANAKRFPQTCKYPFNYSSCLKKKHYFCKKH